MAVQRRPGKSPGRYETAVDAMAAVVVVSWSGVRVSRRTARLFRRVKQAALENPKMAGFYVGQPEGAAGLQVVAETEMAAEATPKPESSIVEKVPYCALPAICVA